MRFSQAMPSRYLKAADVDPELTLTISKWEIERLGQGKDAEDKPVVYFEELDRGLVLNNTNGNTIVEMCGDDMDEWVGHKIVLTATEVPFQGRMTPAIRVKLRRKKTGVEVPPKVQEARQRSRRRQDEDDDPFTDDEE